MGMHRGLTDARYALITAAAIMTGLVLLSVAGTPFSLMGESGQQASLDPGDVEVPGNVSVDPSKYVDEETARSAAEAAGDSGLVKTIARKVFELVSGQDLAGSLPSNMSGGLNGSGQQGTTNNSGGTGDGSLSDSNGSTGGDNQTVSRGNGSTGSGEGNQTTDDGNQTGSGDGNQTDGGGEDTTGNGTDGGSQDPMNDTQDSGDDTGQGNSTGFLSGIMETLSSVLGGSENATAPDQDQDQGQQDTGDAQQDQGQQDQQDSQQDEDGTEESGTETQQQSLRERATGILPYLLAAALLVLAVMFYRSDADAKTFLQRLLERTKDVITDVPDLFRRSVVRAVSTVLAKLRALGRFCVRLAYRPVETVQGLVQRIRERLIAAQDEIQQLRAAGLDGLVASLRGQEPDRDRLEQLWFRLKDELGLSEASVTPAEVQELALQEGLPEGPATELVEAFRQEKYTTAGYPHTLDMDAVERSLWGDQDG